MSNPLSYLYVPMHLDALHLPQDQLVVEAMADFSRLPYFDQTTEREVNGDVANISEEIVSQPFHNENLYLKAGIHLHWALPDAMTKGQHSAEATNFPLVPNRWLVIRNDPTIKATKIWIVESDYCETPDPAKSNNQVTYYHRDGKTNAPYRYLGRTTELNRWFKLDKQQDAYLPPENKLTAIGYGEPTFAAFYPNCHSVFGFYDGDYATQQILPQGLAYTVIGWYSQKDNDFLYKTLDGVSDIADRVKKIQDLCHWTADTANTPLPDQMVCYSRLTFVLPQNSTSSRPSDHNVSVALGNTPSEALATYLSHELSLDDTSRRQIEDQLEYIALGSKLDPHHIDLGAKFEEARHSSGFLPIDGGQIWTIVPQDLQAGKTQSTQGAEQTDIVVALPDEIRTSLSQLNHWQQGYDQSRDQIETMRHQLFSDWYKFMMSSYHPADANRGDDYPDVDLVRFFIEHQIMEPLRQELVNTGKLHLTKDEKGRVTQADAQETFTFGVAAKSVWDTLTAGQQANAITIENWTKLGTDQSLSADLTAILQNHGIQFVTPPIVRPLNGKDGYQIDVDVHQLTLVRKPAPDDDLIKVTYKIYGQKADQVATSITGLLAMLDQLDKSSVLKPSANASNSITVLDANKRTKILSDLAKPITAVSWTVSFSYQWQTSQPASQGNGPVTVATVPAVDETIFVISDPDSTQTLAAFWTSDGRFKLTLNDTHIMESHTRLAADNWLHIALVKSPDRYRVYLNGDEEMVTPASWPFARPPQHAPVVFGGKDNKQTYLLKNIRLDNRVMSESEIRRDMQQAPRLVHALQQTPAPRYYQPNEPVVLLTGGTMQHTERHGQDGRLRDDERLECQIKAGAQVGLSAAFKTNGAPTTLTPKQIEAIYTPYLTAINEIEQENGKKQNFGFSYWIEQPWHPIFFEWQVELFPSRSKTNTAPDHSNYAPDLIQGNYELADNAIDLTTRQDAVGVREDANIYSHQALISNHAGSVLKTAMENYLGDHHIDKDAWPSVKTKKGAEARYLLQNPGGIVPNFSDPLYTVLRAYAALHDENGKLRTFLTQNLGGFNQELLMHKQTLQLPIEDPLGFDAYQAFSQQVANLVAGKNHTAPEPLNAFNPLRTGVMKIQQLRVIDNFGQVQHIQFDQVYRPEHWVLPSSDLAQLPPRIVPPARIDFRLLAAGSQNEEMTADIAHTPICGWLVPNNEEGSLMVYDNSGLPLGVVREREGDVVWDSAPHTHVDLDEIPNPHLKKLINFTITRQDAVNYLSDFITTINIAMEAIEPANFAQHESLALLMGRPMAVVRASCALSLKGHPPINQSWTVFRQDLNRFERETDNLTAVSFPIRLGEYQQLNDGLVGYWQEQGTDKYRHNRFYAPQTPEGALDQSIDHADIAIHTVGDPVNLWRTLDDPPQVLTMLVDPRGVIHATSGILPTKVIHIPPHHYTKALSAIQVTFLTAPILSPHGQRGLPLPDEPGLSWSWLEELVMVEQQRFIDFYGADNGAVVWQHLLKQGWLKLTDAGQPAVAKVISKGHRPHAPGDDHLGAAVAQKLGYPSASPFEEDIEHLLWHEVSHLATIEKYDFVAQYEQNKAKNRAGHGQPVAANADADLEATAVWQRLNEASVGWLRPIPATTSAENVVKAVIAPKDQRPSKSLGKKYATVTDLIEAVLDNASLRLTGIDPHGKFHGPQEIREGWLVLRETNKKQHF